MSRLSELIRGITRWASTPSRLDHLEDIARELLRRDIPFGEITEDVMLPAAGVEFPAQVDGTGWMDAGQMLQARNGTNIAYLEVVSIGDETTVTFRVVELIGFHVGDVLPSGAKIVIGVPSQQRVGYVTSSVGMGWAKRPSGAWTPASTEALLTGRFVDSAGERTRSVSLNLNTADGLIVATTFPLVQDDIKVEVLNDKSESVTVRFTDEVSGYVREHTLFAINATAGEDGADGADGADGIGLLYQGAWSPSVTYHANEHFVSVVNYGGYLYRAKQGSFNEEPIPGASDPYWEMIANLTVIDGGGEASASISTSVDFDSVTTSSLSPDTDTAPISISTSVDFDSVTTWTLSGTAPLSVSTNVDFNSDTIWTRLANAAISVNAAFSGSSFSKSTAEATIGAAVTFTADAVAVV